MTYQVAVPSAGRSATIMGATLGTLARGGVPADRVTLFLPDADQVKAYAQVISATGVNWQAGHGWGLPAARNAIARHYPRGTRLMCFDDDVRAVARCTGPKDLYDLAAGELAGVIDNCFEVSAGHLWGVYPVANPFFMHAARVRRGHLWPIIGSMFGYVVEDDDVELATVDDKDDYERSIKFYLRDGEVVRFDNLTYRTRYLTEPGGMQLHPDRAALNERVARQLAASYPDHATYFKRKNGRAEVKLHDRKRVRV